jgi:hypothetical protein
LLLLAGISDAVLEITALGITVVPVDVDLRLAGTMLA